MTCSTCPNCGFDLLRLEKFKLGDLEIERGCLIHWKGHRVKLDPSRTLIVNALARANGADVSRMALMEAIDSDAKDPSRLLNFHIYQIRKAFRRIDPGFDRIARNFGTGPHGFTRWRI